MITTTNFTKSELEIIEFKKKDIKSYIFIFLKFFLPLSFLLGLLGLANKAAGYWPTTTGIIIIFALVTIYLIVKENILLNKDLRDKTKFTGTITVQKKSRVETDTIIYTDAQEIKKIDVHFFSIFKQIEVGDEIFVEIAKHSKHIFKLSKGESILITGT